MLPRGWRPLSEILDQPLDYASTTHRETKDTFQVPVDLGLIISYG